MIDCTTIWNTLILTSGRLFILNWNNCLQRIFSQALTRYTRHVCVSGKHSTLLFHKKQIRMRYGFLSFKFKYISKWNYVEVIFWTWDYSQVSHLPLLTEGKLQRLPMLIMLCIEILHNYKEHSLSLVYHFQPDVEIST